MKFVKFVQHLNGFFYANLIRNTLIVNELVSFFILSLTLMGFNPQLRNTRTKNKLKIHTIKTQN